MFRAWRTGEEVDITLDGRTVEGEVVMASANGRSLVLVFEALLGGYAGVMPVLWRPEEERYTDLMLGRTVELKQHAASMAGEAADPDV